MTWARKISYNKKKKKNNTTNIETSLMSKDVIRSGGRYGFLEKLHEMMKRGKKSKGRKRKACCQLTEWSAQYKVQGPWISNSSSIPLHVPLILLKQIIGNVGRLREGEGGGMGGEGKRDIIRGKLSAKIVSCRICCGHQAH